MFSVTIQNEKNVKRSIEVRNEFLITHRICVEWILHWTTLIKKVFNFFHLIFKNIPKSGGYKCILMEDSLKDDVFLMVSVSRNLYWIFNQSAKELQMIYKLLLTFYVWIYFWNIQSISAIYIQYQVIWQEFSYNALGINTLLAFSLEDLS